jgi:hypothetical protein
MREILTATKTLLEQAFQERDALIYLAPRTTPYNASKDLEIQVFLGELSVVDHDGSVRRDDFQIHISVLKKTRLDHAARYDTALTNEAESLLEIAQTISDTLDGAFLTGLLVRPLMLARISPVGDAAGVPGLLVQTLTFVGGINKALI